MLIFVVVLVLSALSQAAELELTSSNMCELCHCGPGPGMNPKEKAVCKDIGDGKRIRVASLPTFLTSLVVVNATGGVAIMRGAVRVGDVKFRLTIESASHLEINEKSIMLLGPESEAYLSVDGVENVNLSGRAVTASKPGRFFLRIVRSGIVSIDGRAFDVLTEVTIEAVRVLRLTTAAFKPTLPIETPELRIRLRGIASLPQLPTDAFSSAVSIIVQDSTISEIESSAFSGFSVINVTFVRTNINRIHSRAFLEKLLLNHLLFDNCTITSIADKAISSAISTLEIRNTSLASISEEAIACHVAKIEIVGNTFQTLSHRSFVFQTWNEIIFLENKITFMESGALAGIQLPGEASASTMASSSGRARSNSSFIFSGNHIHYANKDALKVSLPNKIEVTVENNVFFQYCSCGLDQWLSIVCGTVEKVEGDVVDMKSLIQNSSQCQVPELARPCFQSHLVKMFDYVDKFCSSNSVDKSDEDDMSPSCMIISQITPWDVIYQHIEVSSNRGILLLVLVFALSCSLIVAILTLFKWIIYSIRAKTKCHNKSQEWNFTKIEERGHDKSGSEHYENLPLTATIDSAADRIEEDDEDGPISVSIEADSDAGEDSVTPKKRHSVVDDTNGSKTQTDTTHTTLEMESRSKSPPKPTFYDEMIILLQEKLDDPSNYGTVADIQTTCFYQDPQDLQK